MRILAIRGSARVGGSHDAVLRAAERNVPEGVGLRHFRHLAALPLFDPALDEPDAVTELRSALADADGVLFVLPEYGHSLPGALKNAVDWLIGTGELESKLVAIISVSSTPGGGVRAMMALLQTLLALSVQVTALLPIAGVRALLDADGELTDARTVRRITETVRALAESS